MFVRSYVQRLNGSSAEAFNNLGIVLHNLGALRGALQAYDRAVTLRPTFAAAWFNYANLLCFTGALLSDLSAVKSNGYMVGNVRLGIEAYSQALEADPSLLRAVANRAFYRQVHSH